MKKNIIWGLIFILLAVYLVLNALNMLPAFPTFKIIATVVLAFISFKAFEDRNFVFGLIPVAIIGCIFDRELHITALTPWTLIVVAALVGIGLQLIFKGKSHYEGPKYVDVNGTAHRVDGKSGFTEYNEQGGTFKVENAFATTSKYVDIKNLREGKISNGVGSVTVYLEGSTISPEGARINVENGLGSTELYIPSTFRVELTTENGLGKITTFGTCNQDESAPIVNLHVNNGLGAVNIYY